MKNDREQHKIVDAARHLLREDDARQSAFHPNERQPPARGANPIGSPPNSVTKKPTSISVP
jgi:hypothetical protein